HVVPRRVLLERDAPLLLRARIRLGRELRSLRGRRASPRALHVVDGHDLDGRPSTPSQQAHRQRRDEDRPRAPHGAPPVAFAGFFPSWAAPLLPAPFFRGGGGSPSCTSTAAWSTFPAFSASCSCVRRRPT